MHRMTKKFMQSLTVLLAVTITGCKTTTIQQNKIVLPPQPQRQYIEEPQTARDYAYIILYYEQLVQEWELWGSAVEILTAPEKASETINVIIERNYPGHRKSRSE